MHEIFTNEIFLATVVSFAACQLWKTVHNWIVARKFDVNQIFATGGMPSSHTTTVTALTISVGFSEGFASPLFISLIFISLIIIRDALGVRRLVDDIIRNMNMMIKGKLGFKTIIQIAGHTPVQVLVGALLGAAVTIGMHFMRVM